MSKLQFRLNLVPTPQKRAKARVIGRGKTKHPYVSFWDPSADDKKIILELLPSEYRQNLHFHGPVKLQLGYVLKRPKSLGNKSKPHAVRPDVDNLCKLIMDVFNGVLYGDDKQVTDLRVRKRYARVDEEPGICVVIEDDPEPWE